MSVKFLAYQRIIIFNLTVTPLACILNLCSWIIGRSSVVNLDAITQYISLNTINLNNIRSYLKSWLRKQTLVSKGENSKLLEAFLKIPNLNVAVILGKPLHAFTHSYWTHSRTGQRLCILLCLCLIAAILIPDIQTTLCMKIEIVFLARSLQPKKLLVNSFPARIIFTLPIIHLREECVTIVCGLPLGIAIVPRENDDSDYVTFFWGGWCRGPGVNKVHGRCENWEYEKHK